MSTNKVLSAKFGLWPLTVRSLGFIGGMVFALQAIACLGAIDIIQPTTSFTARVIGRSQSNVLVGAPDDAEGTAWISTFLDIKESTSDRVVLEFDLRGRPITENAVLKLNLTNLDVPKFTPIFMYSFEGNGLANASDYFKTTNLITTFTDNGLATNFAPPYHMPFSFDITDTYNEAVEEGQEYLGIIFKNTAAGSQYARYRMWTTLGLPTLVVGVPEPSTVLMGCTALMFLYLPRPLATYRRIPGPKKQSMTAC